MKTLLILSTALSLLACESNNDSEPDVSPQTTNGEGSEIEDPGFPARVHLVVYDRPIVPSQGSNGPLMDALVVLPEAGKSCRTDESGNCDPFDLRYGVHKVVISHPDRPTHTTTLQVDAPIINPTLVLPIRTEDEVKFYEGYYAKYVEVATIHPKVEFYEDVTVLHDLTVNRIEFYYHHEGVGIVPLTEGCTILGDNDLECGHPETDSTGSFTDDFSKFHIADKEYPEDIYLIVTNKPIEN